MSDKKIRVVIADDSALMRKKIGEILNKDPEIEVVAIAKNGREAVLAVHTMKPDVVTLDVEMPEMNGLETLGYIMSECPTPCIMISAFTAVGTKESILALEYGAVDFVTKPSGVVSSDIDKVSEDIIKKVKIASKISVKKLQFIMPKKAVEEEFIVKRPTAISKVFVIASSTGGTQALATILPALRSDLRAVVLVAQHMPEGFTKSLAERLNWQSKISVVEAEEGMQVRPGQVIIAKGGLHMEIVGTADNAHITLNNKPPRLGVRPSADVLMESASVVFGEKVVGIVLTGMGSDGTLGASAIKSAGGEVWTEDEISCVIFGMPRSVMQAGLSDKVVMLRNIAEEMEKISK